MRDQYKKNTVTQNRAIQQQASKNFGVATFNLKGDLNLGLIMRTSALVGAKDFFILGHRGFDRRSAVGVHHYINVEKHEECIDYKSTRTMLIERDYIPIIVEQGGKSLLHFKREWEMGLFSFPSQKPCFIFGPEDTGLDNTWPKHISLEQVGVSRSYNVSSAASIILYNWSFS